MGAIELSERTVAQAHAARQRAPVLVELVGVAGVEAVPVVVRLLLIALCGRRKRQAQEMSPVCTQAAARQPNCRRRRPSFTAPEQVPVPISSQFTTSDTNLPSAPARWAGTRLVSSGSRRSPDGSFGAWLGMAAGFAAACCKSQQRQAHVALALS